METGLQLKVSSNRLVKPGIEPATLAYKMSGLSTTPQRLLSGQLQIYGKNTLKRPLKKKTKVDFQDQLLLNAGQKYCRMLPLEHSAILLTCIELPFVTKTFVLSIFEWRLAA